MELSASENTGISTLAQRVQDLVVSSLVPSELGKAQKIELLDLPNELLEQIALSFDHPKHLCPLLRTSRHLSILLSPVLKKVAAAHSSHTVIRILWAAITRDRMALESLLETGSSLTIKDSSGIVLHEVPGPCDSADKIMNWATKITICRDEGTYKHYSGAGIHWAVEAGGEKLVEMLLDRGVALEDVDSELRTALDLAAMNGHAQLVRMLLKRGANRASRVRFGNTPLHRARDKGHMEAFEALLEENGPVIRYKDNAHLIHLVAAHPFGDDVNAISLLLQRGAKTTDRDDHGKTALHFAAAGGNKRIIELLLEEGADVNDLRSTESVISLACKNGHIEVAKMLFSQLSLSFRDREDKTPLHLAIEHSNYDDIIPHLLDKGFSVHARDAEGATPLHRATLAGKIQVATLLLGHGADINAKDNSSRTALHLVVTSPGKKNKQSTIKALLDMGADVNAEDIHGMTVPHLAVSQKDVRLIRLLMEKPDGSGWIKHSEALKLAIKDGDESMIALVRSMA